MELDRELAQEFAEATSDLDRKGRKESIAYGIVRRESETGPAFVKLDGTDVMTPISMSMDAQDEDRVMVQIREHTATVIGNITSPASARTATNYMQLTKEGLVVGALGANGRPTGTYSLIAPGVYKICSADDKVLASFSSERIELGEGEGVFEKDRISLANGRAEITDEYINLADKMVYISVDGISLGKGKIDITNTYINLSNRAVYIDSTGVSLSNGVAKFGLTEIYLNNRMAVITPTSVRLGNGAAEFTVDHVYLNNQKSKFTSDEVSLSGGIATFTATKISLNKGESTFTTDSISLKNGMTIITGESISLANGMAFFTANSITLGKEGVSAVFSTESIILGNNVVVINKDGLSLANGDAVFGVDGVTLGKGFAKFKKDSITLANGLVYLDATTLTLGNLNSSVINMCGGKGTIKMVNFSDNTSALIVGNTSNAVGFRSVDGNTAAEVVCKSNNGDPVISLNIRNSSGTVVNAFMINRTALTHNGNSLLTTDKLIFCSKVIASGKVEAGHSRTIKQKLNDIPVGYRLAGIRQLTTNHYGLARLTEFATDPTGPQVRVTYVNVGDKNFDDVESPKLKITIEYFAILCSSEKVGTTWYATWPDADDAQEVSMF